MTSTLSTTTPYIGSQPLTSLDSFEGVPDWFEPRVELASRALWQQWAQRFLAWAADLAPGVALAAALAWAAAVLSQWLGVHGFGLRESPISPILAAVVLGLLLRNLIGVPATYERGLRFCLRTILRAGIVLLGLRLSIAELGRIGLLALPVIGGCIAVALLAVTAVSRAMHLPPRLGSLIAVGTSICGISAIVATAPVIEAEEDEVSYAVACITLFGLIGFFVYPFLAHWLFNGQPRLVGLFLGTAIHDTSQVTGAALAYQQQYGSPQALNVAVVAKLVRNLAMALVIPIVVILHRSGKATEAGGMQNGRPRWRQRLRDAVPVFVLLFMAMVLVRSIGDWSCQSMAVPEPGLWQLLQDRAKEGSLWMLATAMASVGLATGLAKLRSLGLRPLCAGLAAAAVVAAASFVLVSVFAPWMR
jgi:uncharacterized integral membrane protein (TIGR00698 family)